MTMTSLEHSPDAYTNAPAPPTTIEVTTVQRLLLLIPDVEVAEDFRERITADWEPEQDNTWGGRSGGYWVLMGENNGAGNAFLVHPYHITPLIELLERMRSITPGPDDPSAPDLPAAPDVPPGKSVS